MTNYFRIIQPFLFSLPEENAHKLAIWALKKKILPQCCKQADHAILHNKVCGLNFRNPVGLAAGFDKNAEAIDGLSSQSFGFIETGTVTPLAQEGNPKPRVFRLNEDMAIINRMGFNNDGADVYADNLRTWQKKKIPYIVGANIGKNKETENAEEDYLIMMDKIYGFSDYITINISSPNTSGLRNLQKKKALDSLLSSLINKKNEFIKGGGRNIPLFVKIAPDLDNKEKENIADVAITHKIDGLIISNTTVKRGDLKSGRYVSERGGLSGGPLFQLSTQMLRDMYILTEGTIPLIGAGGIFSGDDAYEKIRAGASLVQIYTSLIYNGFGIVGKINNRLAELLEYDGFTNISQAIGVDSKSMFKTHN